MRHHVGKQWILCGEEEEEARAENVGFSVKYDQHSPCHRRARQRTKRPTFSAFGAALAPGQCPIPASTRS